MKSHIALTAIIMASLAQFGLSQSASELGLKLKATKSSSSATCENLDKGEQCVKYRMTFENTGSEPVIIFNPTLSFGSGIKSIHLYSVVKNRETNETEEKEIHQSDAKRDSDADEVFRSLFPLLQDSSPPENSTITLDMGEEFTFEEMFVAQKFLGLIFDNEDEYDKAKPSRTGYSCNFGKKIICVPFGAKARLIYQFSAPASADNPNLLDVLALRWRRHGRLPLDQSGNYKVTSELTNRYF